MVGGVSSHTLSVEVAGVRLSVEVRAGDGDPALAREFADQVAAVVEQKLFAMTDENSVDAEPEGA